MGRTQHRHSYYGLCKACTSIKGTNTGICARCASSVLSLLSANERHQRCLTFLTSITYTQQDDRQRRAVNPRDVEHASSQRSFRQVPCWLSTLEGLRQRVPSLGTCKHPVPSAQSSTRRLLPKPARGSGLGSSGRVHRIKAPSCESRSARWQLTRRPSAPPTSPTLGCATHALHCGTHRQTHVVSWRTSGYRQGVATVAVIGARCRRRRSRK